MNLPSLYRSGTSTPAKSTCPQGCAKYQAAVRFGAKLWAILPCCGVAAPVHAMPLQIVGMFASVAASVVPVVFTSLLMMPLGVRRPTVGCSADTEKALPKGAATV